MGDLSPHFDRREFDCHDGQIAHPDPVLIQRLESLRAICGNKPCHIVSGYRDVNYNRSIGGARNSQHLYNRAADLDEGYATIAQAEQAGFAGIGHCNGWAVHVDVRPGGRTLFSDC